MSDLFNGWPEDGEPVLTMSDDEVVRWLNKTQDTIVEQAAKIERLEVMVKDREDLIDYKERQIMKERHRRIKAEKRIAALEGDDE